MSDKVGLVGDKLMQHLDVAGDKKAAWSDKVAAWGAKRAEWGANKEEWADKKAEWAEKKHSLLLKASVWYDKLMQHLAGDSDGLGALLSAASSGREGLAALGLDPDAAMKALAPMLGLENDQDAKALMEGLQTAGFDDLIKEFTSAF